MRESILDWEECEEKFLELPLQHFNHKISQRKINIVEGQMPNSFSEIFNLVISNGLEGWINGNNADRWNWQIIVPNEVENLTEKSDERIDLIASLEASHKKFLCSSLGMKLRSNSHPDISLSDFEKEISRINRPLSHVISEGRRD